MPTLDEADVVCPFYQHTAKLTTSCEGITDDCIIKLCFNSFKQMYNYRKINCCGRYKACKIYSMLEKKYEK